MECEYFENHDLTMFNDIILEHYSLIAKKDYNGLIDILKKKNFRLKNIL